MGEIACVGAPLELRRGGRGRGRKEGEEGGGGRRGRREEGGEGEGEERGRKGKERGRGEGGEGEREGGREGEGSEGVYIQAVSFQFSLHSPDIHEGL